MSRAAKKYLEKHGLPRQRVWVQNSFLESILHEGGKLPTTTARLTSEQILQITPFLASLEAKDLRRYVYSEFKSSIFATDPYALKVFSRILFYLVGDSNAAEDYEQYAEILIVKWQLL